MGSTPNTVLRALLFIGVLSGCTWLSMAGGTEKFDPHKMCLLVANATFINDPRSCNAWIQCVDRKPLPGRCADGLFYNVNANNCVPAGNKTCRSSDPCAAKPNGFSPDPYSCSGYYLCSNGTGIHMECASGLQYNPKVNACLGGNYTCSLTEPDNYCNIMAEGVFFKNASDCHGWQVCTKGQLVGDRCSLNYRYNAFAGYCDRPQNVKCDEEEEESNERPNIKELCTQAGRQFPDNRTCNGFYHCQELPNGDHFIIHTVCPAEQFFDSKLSRCVDRTLVNCPYERCVGLGNFNIQLTNSANTTCKGYLLCQDGLNIGAGKCPGELYFDQRTQRCTEKVIAYPSCV